MIYPQIVYRARLFIQEHVASGSNRGTMAIAWISKHLAGVLLLTDLYLHRPEYIVKSPILFYMKPVLLIATFIVFGLAARAQTTEDSVKAAVNFLFDGMRASDAAKIQSAFADSAVLQTIANTKEGKLVIKNESVALFAASISKLPNGAADERIIFVTIKIDGPLASVWTPYKFYYNGQFSHCGVDSYQLVRINGTWKIQYLIDTRRKQPCE